MYNNKCIQPFTNIPTSLTIHPYLLLFIVSHVYYLLDSLSSMDHKLIPPKKKNKEYKKKNISSCFFGQRQTYENENNFFFVVIKYNKKYNKIICIEMIRMSIVKS